MRPGGMMSAGMCPVHLLAGASECRRSRESARICAGVAESQKGGESMCCHGTPHRSHGWHGHAGVGGCCCAGPGMRRQFLSKEERLARLRAYLEDLKAEAHEVERVIRKLETEE